APWGPPSFRCCAFNSTWSRSASFRSENAGREGSRRAALQSVDRLKPLPDNGIQPSELRSKPVQRLLIHRGVPHEVVQTLQPLGDPRRLLLKPKIELMEQHEERRSRLTGNVARQGILLLLEAVAHLPDQLQLVLELSVDRLVFPVGEQRAELLVMGAGS